MSKNESQSCCEKFKTSIGGQALIEGIMMRGPQKDAIAIRKGDEIDLKINPTTAIISMPPASTPSGENNLGIASSRMKKAIIITKTEITTAPRIENL